MNEEDLKEIKKLYKFMVKEDLLELDLQDKDFKLKLKRKSDLPEKVPLSYVTQETPLVKTCQENDQLAPGVSRVVAPLGGVFYRAPSPGAAPFVSEGEEIRQGQTLCIIEAMKVMNEIQAEISGKIVKILPENGKRIDAEKTLFLVASN